MFSSPSLTCGPFARLGQTSSAACCAAWAFCEDKRGEERKAIEILQRGVSEVTGDTKLKTLLERAQNDKRFKLDAFGELWWQFWLETPPVMQQQGFVGGQGGGFSLRGMKGARGGRRR